MRWNGVERRLAALWLHLVHQSRARYSTRTVRLESIIPYFRTMFYDGVV